MVEVELKFQVPAAQRDAVRQWVAEGSARPRRRTRLQAAYFDTPERLLAQAGMALRLRREGGRWVQTLKGLGDDGISRDEHNVPLASHEVDARDPQPVLLRHAEVPVGQRLLALLAALPPGALRCSYRTDIWRLSRPLRSRLGTVELAFDEGWLIAGGHPIDPAEPTEPGQARAAAPRRLKVCELEIELLSGHPLAVLAVARRWAVPQGLWLDTRSKAERGDLLARGESMAPPRAAAACHLSRQQGPVEALRAVVAACRDQVIVNAAQVASGEWQAEHLHQLRVGLRRLRSGLRLMGEGSEGADVTGGTDAELMAICAPLAEPAAALFRRLGASRDAAVMDGELSRALAAAMQSLGIEANLPTPEAAASVSPTAVLREPAQQALLLDLIATGLPPAASALPQALPSAPKPPKTLKLRALMARRLDRWQRAVMQEAQAFASLDDTGRHRLRKRIKRLRYAAEFTADLFDAKRLRKDLRPLRRAQQDLGELNDVAVGLQAFDAVKGRDPHAWFALGWLAARREVLLARCALSMQDLAASRRCWKR